MWAMRLSDKLRATPAGTLLRLAGQARTPGKLSSPICSLMGSEGVFLLMNLRRANSFLLLIFFFAAMGPTASAQATAANAPAAKNAPQAAILPQTFGGWQLQGALQTSSDPATADPTNPVVLKEYGFTDFAGGSYTQEDGRKLTVRAARFADASGAYGAFTFYKQPEMLNEKIGDQASSLNNRVLFYRGSVLVDAVFDKLSAMSAAELRELASDVPLPQGSARNLPALPTLLPKQDYIRNTAKYVMGPTTLDKLGSPLPADLVDFNAGAEVVLGTYRGSGGEGTLVLISYPTPQIAGDHLKKIESAHSAAPASGTSPVVEVGTFGQKRTGPIVAVAAGLLSESEAKSLLGRVNYNADVTWNENTFFDKKNNVANLLWNVVLLCGALMGITLVAGFAFGGAKLALKRLLPEEEQTEEEFISLNLDEAVAKAQAGMGVSTQSRKPV